MILLILKMGFILFENIYKTKNLFLYINNIENSFILYVTSTYKIFLKKNKDHKTSLFVFPYINIFLTCNNNKSTINLGFNDRKKVFKVFTIYFSFDVIFNSPLELS